MRAPTHRRLRKALLSLAVIGVLGSLAGFGSYSAFTATTTNTGNSFSAGTVVISQHAGATTLYNASNQAPSGSTSACVRVTYTGSLPAAVELYASPGITNGSLFHLKIERGSGLTSPDNTMNCTGFSASSTAFDGNLDTIGTSYAAGIAGKSGGASWAQNDSVDYRFTITVNDDTTANAHTSATGTGSHSFTWEAQST